MSTTSALPSQAGSLPAHKRLSRLLYRTLQNIHDESRTASADTIIPDVARELGSIVTEYLWQPQHSLSSLPGLNAAVQGECHSTAVHPRCRCRRHVCRGE
jgi:hypothetical protein